MPAYDRVHVVPNAVRVSAPVAEPRQGDGLVFTGSMTFRPNREGLEWFVREVLPEVRARRPDAVLRVTGDPGPVDFSQAAGVEMLGYVDDLSRPMGDAAVAIVPIWSGGGTRIKLLEALAARKAVVSTTLGAEGLRVEHGRHLLIADDREAWVEAIVELLGHGERRAQLAAAGRALVEERYDSRRVGDRFVQLAEQIASRSPAAEVRP